MNHSYYEFFAGGGMARLGLGSDWTCLLANDIDPKKMQTYRDNFGEAGTVLCDIGELKTKEMPGRPDLAWASFPCQDLSLAGNREGLDGERSGAFWGFWSAVNRLKLDGRPPHVLVLENVCGLLTSHDGRDFTDLCRAIASLGYRFGAIVADAVKFLPQSRPRLFVICVRDRAVPPTATFSDSPSDWHSTALRTAANALPSHLRAKWIWWQLPEPALRSKDLMDLIDHDAFDHRWHSEAETRSVVENDVARKS